MCKTLPASHVAAEPWFQYLRTLKQPEHAGLTPCGLLARRAPERTLVQAAVDVAEQRARATILHRIFPILAAGRHAAVFPVRDPLTGPCADYDRHTDTLGEDRLRAAAPRRHKLAGY